MITLCILQSILSSSAHPRHFPCNVLYLVQLCAEALARSVVLGLPLATGCHSWSSFVNLGLGLHCSPSQYSGMCNILFLTCGCLWDVKPERHRAQFLGCVKGLSSISAQHNSCYKGVPAVLELCGRLFVWVLFYCNLWQCKCCYFLKRCSCTKKSTFCGLCLLWVTSTGQAKYLCK